MRRMFLSSLLTTVTLWAAAQDDPGRGRPPKNEIEAQEMMRRLETREMEELRSSDPDAYERMQAHLKRMRAIEDVLARFREAKLSDAEAAQALYPLMKTEMGPEIETLGERIERLEKKLSRLRQAKRNPDAWIRQRIEAMLGRRQIDPGIAGVEE